MENIESAKPSAGGKTKFIIGGILIVAAIVYLIVSSTTANSQYFLTVEELEQKGNEMVGRELRVSGAVIGDTIDYDPAGLELHFTVAHIPGDQKEIDAQGGIAQVLHHASQDETLPRLSVHYIGVMPDLLKNEAQAIMTGEMGEDGVFYAKELLLKCPTKYEEAIPDQAANTDD